MLRVGLEPEIERGVQQVQHQALALGYVAGRGDAVCGGKVLRLQFADVAQQILHRRAAGRRGGGRRRLRAQRRVRHQCGGTTDGGGAEHEVPAIHLLFSIGEGDVLFTIRRRGAEAPLQACQVCRNHELEGCWCNARAARSGRFRACAHGRRDARTLRRRSHHAGAARAPVRGAAGAARRRCSPSCAWRASTGLRSCPSGGRTGLSGGAVAARGEVVVSMERMNRLLEFSPGDRSITVEAGMITAQLQQHAASRDLMYAVDFASAGSSHIGGNIATNAGGIKVIRYGMTRDQVLGLKVVDGRGQILELNRGLVKNNTGPDLRHLFIGSEGILGIITEATLALRNAPGPLEVMLLAVRDFASIMDVLRVFSRGITLSAFEFFGHNGLERVLQRRQRKSPLGVAAPFYVLLEFERGSAEPPEQAMRPVRAVRGGGLGTGRRAQPEPRRRRVNCGCCANRCPRRWRSGSPTRTTSGCASPALPAFIARAQTLVAARVSTDWRWCGTATSATATCTSTCSSPRAMPVAQFAGLCSRVTHEHRRAGARLRRQRLRRARRRPVEEAHPANTRAALPRSRRCGRSSACSTPPAIMNPGKVFDP